MDYNFILNRYSQIRKVISRELSLVENLKNIFIKKKLIYPNNQNLIFFLLDYKNVYRHGYQKYFK